MCLAIIGAVGGLAGMNLKNTFGMCERTSVLRLSHCSEPACARTQDGGQDVCVIMFEMQSGFPYFVVRAPCCPLFNDFA